MSLRSNIPRPDEPIAVQVQLKDGTTQWLANKTWYNWFSILTYQDIVNIDIQSQLAFLTPKPNVDETNHKLGELRSVVMAQRNYQAQIDALTRQVKALEALVHGRH